MWLDWFVMLVEIKIEGFEMIGDNKQELNKINADSKTGDIKLIELEYETKPLTVLCYENEVFFKAGHIGDIVGAANIRKSLLKYVSINDTEFFNLSYGFSEQGCSVSPTRFINTSGLIDFLSARTDDASLKFHRVFSKRLLPFCSSATLFAAKIEPITGAITRRYFNDKPLTLFTHNDGRLFVDFGSLVRILGIQNQSPYVILRRAVSDDNVENGSVGVISGGRKSRKLVRSDAVLDFLLKVRRNKEIALEVRGWLVDKVIPSLVAKPKASANAVVGFNVDAIEDEYTLIAEPMPDNTNLIHQELPYKNFEKKAVTMQPSTNELMTAQQARELAATMRNNKELDKLMQKTSAEIQKAATDGCNRLFIEDKDWHDGYEEKYKLASAKLISNGYKVEPHIDRFSYNNQAPDSFYGVMIKWD